MLTAQSQKQDKLFVKFCYHMINVMGPNAGAQRNHDIYGIEL